MSFLLRPLTESVWNWVKSDLSKDFMNSTIKQQAFRTTQNYLETNHPDSILVQAVHLGPYNYDSKQAK